MTATGVPVDITSLTIAFSDVVVKYSGNAFTSSTDSYLKDSVVVFKKNGSSGTNVSSADYSVSINSTRKTITITLNKKLPLNTKYYVGIKASSLKTAAGTAVAASGADLDDSGDTGIKQCRNNFITSARLILRLHRT
jgi:hypothetical protein